ncbi:hypothetical protein CDL12_16438 [Handroanthus impetiginosus]|uniref:Uncharacterized protein n=1 Tax=Handroanthus impetiginosus TaxID=429701 RepID=A0A2G9H095_9LAMI|nr:hypothetical protein CDL12_16438 [Handroanthus impetiginosus]
MKFHITCLPQTAAFKFRLRSATITPLYQIYNYIQIYNSRRARVPGNTKVAFRSLRLFVPLSRNTILVKTSIHVLFHKYTHKYSFSDYRYKYIQENERISIGGV